MADVEVMDEHFKRCEAETNFEGARSRCLHELGHAGPHRAMARHTENWIEWMISDYERDVARRVQLWKPAMEKHYYIRNQRLTECYRCTEAQARELFEAKAGPEPTHLFDEDGLIIASTDERWPVGGNSYEILKSRSSGTQVFFGVEVQSK